MIKSKKFIIILSIYLSFVLNITFLKSFIEAYQFDGFFSSLCGIGLFFIVPLPVYMLLNIILVKWLVKPLSVILVLLSSITNYQMLKMGIRIDSSMIRNVFETNTREAFDLITLSFVLWFFITGIIPCVFILRTKIKFDNFKTEFISRFIRVIVSFLIMLMFTLAFYKVLAPFARNNRKIQNTYNTVNYIYATVRYIQEEMRKNKEFEILDNTPKPDMFEDNLTDVIVIIVGETARGANFSLGGYEVKTNPLLEKQKNLVYSTDVSSCGTATAISVPCLFSSKEKDKFDISNANYEENLLDILAKAGWRIIWKENDDGCKGVCDRVENYNMQNSKSKHCFGDYCHDEVLLEGLEDTLNSIKPKEKTIIILHTMGSHGPTYYKRYPDKFKKFTPTCDTADIQSCTQEELVNTYNNTIVYTDYIISSTIDIVKKYPNFESSVLYISDHGESLGENGIYLHGFPYAIAPKEQKVVPFIMWFSDNLLKYDHLDFDCIKNFKKTQQSLSHDFFFHTLIGLSETDTKLYNKNFDFLNACRKERRDFMKR